MFAVAFAWEACVDRNNPLLIRHVSQALIKELKPGSHAGSLVSWDNRSFDKGTEAIIKENLVTKEGVGLKIFIGVFHAHKKMDHTNWTCSHKISRLPGGFVECTLYLLNWVVL